MRRLAAILTASSLLAGPALAAEAPSPATIKAQAELRKTLPFADRQDFDFATRGFVGTLADPVIKRADGGVAWDASAWDFTTGEAPATVNPSLWRQAQLLRSSTCAHATTWRSCAVSRAQAFVCRSRTARTLPL